MDLTKHEQALLAAARTNRTVTGSWLFLVGGALMTMSVVADLITSGSIPRERLEKVLIWVMFLTAMFMHTRITNTACSLVAKLDGSYKGANETPRTLGISGPPASPLS